MSDGFTREQLIGHALTGLTVDDLIETLVRLKTTYPSVGTALVVCPVALSAPFYDKGYVYLGCELVPLETGDAPSSAVH